MKRSKNLLLPIIPLRGKVLKIGGLKEKIPAAHRANITTVIIPKADKNEPMRDISEKVRRRIRFVFADDLDKVIETALLEPPGSKSRRRRKRPGASRSRTPSARHARASDPAATARWA